MGKVTNAYARVTARLERANIDGSQPGGQLTSGPEFMHIYAGMDVDARELDQFMQIGASQNLTACARLLATTRDPEMLTATLEGWASQCVLLGWELAQDREEP